MNTLSTIRLPAFLSAALVFPLLLLELGAGNGEFRDFPVFLFMVLWVVPFVAILLLSPLIYDMLNAKAPINTRSLLVRLTILFTLAAIWTRIVIDQMPCFFGAANCD